MNRIFYLLLMMAVFAACKKSDSLETNSTPETEPLTGTWEQILFIPQLYTPASYTFKTDHSYSKFLMGDKVGEKGTYQTIPVNDLNIFTVLLKKNGAVIPDTIHVEKISSTEISIRESGLEVRFQRK